MRPDNFGWPGTPASRSLNPASHAATVLNILRALYKANAKGAALRSFPKLRLCHAPQKNCSGLRFFEVFPDGESFPQFFANREVVVAAEAAVKNCLGFLDIR